LELISLMVAVAQIGDQLRAQAAVEPHHRPERSVAAVMATTPRRETLERPYLADHLVSQRQAMSKGIKPRGLGHLVTWAKNQWAIEVPDDLHKRGVWRDYGEAAVGASLLGAPQYSDGFRAYLEGSDHQTDALKNDPDDPERHYTKPMHRALAEIAGRDPNTDWWYHAHFLFLTALANFEWRVVGERALIPYPVQAPYATYVFGLWWDKYTVVPQANVA
jgi:hypothetical protein